MIGTWRLSPVATPVFCAPPDRFTRLRAVAPSVCHFTLAPSMRVVVCLVLLGATIGAAAVPVDASRVFPPRLESYGDSQMTGLWSVLQHRIQQQPLNLWATLLFFGAILHTF